MEQRPAGEGGVRAPEAVQATRVQSTVPVDSAAEPGESLRPSLIRCLRELAGFRELLLTLTAREIKVRYKQTLLGVTWAIVQPLALMIVFSVFFGRLAHVPSDGLPYPLFSYAALLPWSFFTTSLAFGVPSLVTNTTLVTRVYFPREVLPLAAVLSAAVDFGAAALVYGGMMALYRVAPTLAFLYLIPLVTIQVVFTLAVTLVLSAINVSYRDVRYALPLVTQLWLYVTPVIYPLSVIPARFRTAYLTLNPMAAVIDGYRRVLVAGSAPDLRTLGVAGVSAAILIAGGYGYFKRAERHFADVI
jgi:lipopolysaccharide transport system permease protein